MEKLASPVLLIGCLILGIIAHVLVVVLIFSFLWKKCLYLLELYFEILTVDKLIHCRGGFAFALKESEIGG